LALQKQAPTRALADKLLDERLAAPFKADANDYLYQWDSSRDYNASPGLERIKAALLVINAADDERNPLGRPASWNASSSVPGAQLYLIPASVETRGSRQILEAQTPGVSGVRAPAHDVVALRCKGIEPVSSPAFAPGARWKRPPVRSERRCGCRA